MLGMHWVGDLAVSATVELESNAGQVVLELVKGGRQFQCRLDAANGRATLSTSGDDMQDFHPSAQTNFRGPGKYDLMFSNCDDNCCCGSTAKRWSSTCQPLMTICITRVPCPWICSL